MNEQPVSANSYTVVQSSTSAQGQSVSAVLAGSGGSIQVNGDHLEVKNGELILNRVSYGNVGKTSVIHYTVKVGMKTVTVDGIVRQPLAK
jgi:hypothetical protein